jgi:hypothetical protein
MVFIQEFTWGLSSFHRICPFWLLFVKWALQKIIVRRYHRIFIWVIMLAATAVLTPFFSMEMLPLAAVGAAVTITAWLESVSRQNIKETFFVLIVLATLVGQFLLF